MRVSNNVTQVCICVSVQAAAFELLWLKTFFQYTDTSWPYLSLSLGIKVKIKWIKRFKKRLSNLDFYS